MASFTESFDIIDKILKKINISINADNYDGIIVKKLEKTNTLDPDSGKQYHIAITGKQMDIFPCVLRANGYFDSETEDQNLKKYFLLQYPFTTYKQNIIHLGGKPETYDSNKKISYVSVLLSKRKNETDQIQVSILKYDDTDFIAFRRLIHVGYYFILLKKNQKLEYDVFAIKNDDSIDISTLTQLNGCFEKKNTTTIVKTDQTLNNNSISETVTSELNISTTEYLKEVLSNKPYITSLLAKPFVIIAGNSGTGKTKMATDLAKKLKIDATKLNHPEKDLNDESIKDYKIERNYLVVPVGSDWTDNTKILGYYNSLNNRYETTEILEFIITANENTNIPFFLILDEMNLSRVERYFSDFLSKMETVKYDSDSEEEYFNLQGGKRVKFPKNLFITGTVNIDETTYMFSPKVLDRANVIEFKPNNVLDVFLEDTTPVKIEPAQEGVAEKFLELAKKVRIQNSLNEKARNATVNGETKETVKLLDEILGVLRNQGKNFEFAYRTAKEIKQYMNAAFELDENTDVIQLVDEQLLQKIMPKIHGNRSQIQNLLSSLLNVCNKNGLNNSKEKIESMQRQLQTNQFASFI